MHDNVWDLPSNNIPFITQTKVNLIILKFLRNNTSLPPTKKIVLYCDVKRILIYVY